MRTTDCLGILFPNAHDDLMFEMTEHRSMGSIPFASRYRFVDFSLSLLINAGISKVGILTKANYLSLMDHLGSGKAWDLDRKNGGLFILPPFAYGEGTYTGHIDALQNAMNFLKHSTEEYVVLCDCDVITNFSLEEMIDNHVDSGADITIAYKYGKLPENPIDVSILALDGDKVVDVLLGGKHENLCNYSLDVIIMSRKKLIEMVSEATAHSQNSISRDFLQAHVNDMDIRGYKVEDYAEILDGPDAYFRISRELLTNNERRNSLFNPERPIFTKTRDDMPTKYGLDSAVSGSLIGDGCVIEGTVKNSVIFRGVTVGKGAVVENCIVMQDSIVGEGAEIKNVTLDKDVTVSANITLCGAECYPMYIRKGSKV